MPRAKKKTGRPHPPPMQTFIFEIKEWKPEYSWSINQDKFRDAPYDEYLTLDLKSICIYPSDLAGRMALFALMAQRDCLVPEVYRRDHEWKPRCVGALVLRPSDGRFYMRLPHESYPALLTAMAHGFFRYVDLYGPKLRYGQSYCSSFRLVHSVDLEDYP